MERDRPAGGACVSLALILAYVSELVEITETESSLHTVSGWSYGADVVAVAVGGFGSVGHATAGTCTAARFAQPKLAGKVRERPDVNIVYPSKAGQITETPSELDVHGGG